MLNMAWKVFVPLALINIVLVGVVTKITSDVLWWVVILLPANVIVALITLAFLNKAQERRLARARELVAQGWSRGSTVGSELIQES